MSQTRKPLPQSLVGAIRATCGDQRLTAQQKFEAVVLIAHGFGLWTALESMLDPSSYAIPQEQWEEVAAMLNTIDRGSPLDEVTVALGWMNLGPSAYDPAKEASRG